tara:strand:+ start:33080 stop:33853 length:774 start_codon:yes stop_codon:yes gene_type:complete
VILNSHKFSRFSAASAHLALSVVLFTVLLTALLLFWYPSAFFSASGGWQGLRLVAAVDIVLGPLLTFIIYNRKKSSRELIMDLGVVVVLQLCALGWGIKTVYEQRPIAVVFLDNSFYTVPAAALNVQGIDLKVLDEFADSRPVYVYVRRPVAGEELERFTHEIEQNRIPPHEQVWLYQPLSQNFANVVRSSVNVKEVMETNPEMKSDIEHLLDRTASQLEDYYYLPLTSRYRNILLIFDTEGDLVDTVSAPYKSGEV